MKSQINSKWGTKRKESHGLCFSILGTAVRVQGCRYQCFSEISYVSLIFCQKTDALTLSAFPPVILKDCSNTLPGELSWNIKSPQLQTSWPKNEYFLSWWRNPFLVRLDCLVTFKNCMRFFFFPCNLRIGHWLESLTEQENAATLTVVSLMFTRSPRSSFSKLLPSHLASKCLLLFFPRILLWSLWWLLAHITSLQTMPGWQHTN